MISSAWTINQSLSNINTLLQISTNHRYNKILMWENIFIKLIAVLKSTTYTKRTEKKNSISRNIVIHSTLFVILSSLDSWTISILYYACYEKYWSYNMQVTRDPHINCVFKFCFQEIPLWACMWTLSFDQRQISKHASNAWYIYVYRMSHLNNSYSSTRFFLKKFITSVILSFRLQ